MGVSIGVISLFLIDVLRPPLEKGLTAYGVGALIFSGKPCSKTVILGNLSIVMESYPLLEIFCFSIVHADVKFK